ncbi:MAG: arabinosyltransferase, partial [Frankiaceae bacterium]|nr:arabinosyltransferase [Frankiaceae bacterium]
WSLIWMRLLVALLGLGTYALLRRALRLLLGPAGERSTLSRAPWLLALAHLAWWLPYGLTLRPEPVIVLGSAATLVLAETARRHLSLGLLALAIAVAAVTTTASPSGLVAWAPVIVQVRWVGRCFVGASPRERLAAALVLLAAPTAAIPIAFADASLGTVAATHATQRAFYPDLRWYDEILHVAALFEPGDVASWGRRLPVLLTFACVLLAVTGTRGARTPHGRSRPTVEQALLRVSVMVGIGVAVLALSPTKWVNHYGALAGLGTPALALVMLRFPLFGGRWSTTARLGGTLLVALGLAASFAGPNMWRPITDWGQPFGERPIPALDRTAIRPYTPHLGPFYGSTLVLWLLLAAVIFAVVWRRRGSRRLAGAVTGSALLTLGLTLGVVLMGVVFVVAPVRQSPAWSAAASNWRAATGTDCGLADAVQVDPDGPRPGSEPARFVRAREALTGQVVFVDVKVRPVWPCEGSTTAADGLTELPRYRILAGEGFAGDTDMIYRSAARGGVQTVLDREARVIDLPTRQIPTGPGQTSFGSIQRVEYDLPTAGYDLRSGHRQIAGWTVGHPLVPPDVERRSEAAKSSGQRAAERRQKTP